jgi:hypothetical protein
MVQQLLLAKRLYLEACEYAARPDAVSCGIAVSMFQDAAEMLVWALIKARGVSVKEGSSFTTNLELLQKDGFAMPDAPRLLELNKARVGFKHYGNLPAPEEARKYQAYVEAFLRTASAAQFSQDIDQLSLVDLIAFEDVREQLKEAERFVAEAEYSNAVRHASIAKVLLFAKLAKHVPAVDRSLSEADGVLSAATELRGFRAFRYVAGYLDLLRDVSIITLLRIPLSDYAFLQSTLMQAARNVGGTWQTNDSRGIKYGAEICTRQISCLVSISLRIEGMT